MTVRAVATGIGHYLPARVVENSEFEKTLDTSDEWIRTRSGIERRHFAAEGETTSHMAVHAAKAALAMAELKPDDIDAVIVATSTPDLTFPSVGTMVQAGLGMTRGFAYDVQAVCAGFIYALANANGMILSGQAERVLVIGAETFSRIMDWEDRSTCVLFGDGAGAVVLEAREGEQERGVIASKLHADGEHKELLYVDGGPSSTGTVGKLRMKGREVFRHAVVNLAEVLGEVLEEAGVAVEQIDWVVPHQANARILDATARKLGLPAEKVVVTVDRHANTSAASVPLALDTAIRDGRIKQGDLVMLEAMGGGFTWGASLLKL